MKRLTNDNPQDNVSSALNLFYVKDGWTWVRGGGPGQDYADISLNDYVRMIAGDHGLEIAKSSNEDEISCEMAELLFDGTSTAEGIVATLYTAVWAFAEIRERLKMYEDTVSLERAKELTQAEKDGRLVVLPVPVGKNKLAYALPGSFSRNQEIFTIECERLDGLEIWDNPGHEIVVLVDGCEIGESDIGKTVFLTCEEAEEALKKREADNEAD